MAITGYETSRLLANETEEDRKKRLAYFQGVAEGVRGLIVPQMPRPAGQPVAATPIVPITPVPSAQPAVSPWASAIADLQNQAKFRMGGTVQDAMANIPRGVLGQMGGLATTGLQTDLGPRTLAQTQRAENFNVPGRIYASATNSPQGEVFAGPREQVLSQLEPQPTRNVLGERAAVQALQNQVSPVIANAAERYRQQFAASTNLGPRAEERMADYRGLLRQQEQDRFGQEMARGQLANQLEVPRIEAQGRENVATITSEGGITREEAAQRGMTERQRIEANASMANAATLAAAGGTQKEQMQRQQLALNQARAQITAINNRRRALIEAGNPTPEALAALEQEEAAVWQGIQGGGQQGAPAATGEAGVPPVPASGDVNGDGKVDDMDLKYRHALDVVNAAPNDPDATPELRAKAKIRVQEILAYWKEQERKKLGIAPAV